MFILSIAAWCAAVCLAPASLGATQSDDVQVTAGLSNGVIKLGERTSIVVSVDRQNATRIPKDTRFGELPTVDGLDIGAVSGPTTSQFSSGGFGRRTTTTLNMRWVIPVRPTRAGEFEIPQFELEVAGAHYATPVMRLKVVEDMKGSELGFLEVTPSATKVVEGQPFTIEVRFGWDEALKGVNFADLSLGFWDGIPGAIDVDTEFPPPGSKRIESGVTVNGSKTIVVEELPARELRGRTFRNLRAQIAYLPTRGGRIELPESYLNFGRAEDRGSFFDRRMVKTEDYYVAAPKRYVDVSALPEEGRPLDFTGAVGTLTAHADVDRRDVDQGDSIKLTVEWTGSGNLEFFDAPEIGRMDAFDGFRVYGHTDEKRFGRRKTVYDLAPLSPELDAIPPVPLPVYDPEQEAYVTLETSPIPLRVRALEGGGLGADVEERELARDLRDIDARPLTGDGAGASNPPRTAVLAVLFGAPLLGLLARAVVRRRGDPSTPAARRRRSARRRLAKDLSSAKGPEDELRALYAFLAARTGEPPEAWVGRDVVDAARTGGGGAASNRVEPESAEKLARTIERLETAVWSGRNGHAAVPAADVLSLADRLMKEGL